MLSEPIMKRWTFPVEEHGKLMAAMESLKPNVTIGPLPFFIMRILKTLQPKISGEVDDSLLSRIDPVLVDSLFEFQKEGIVFGISRHGRVLIADDMGLGKTIQALGIAHYYRNEWPLLIVSPSSMRFAFSTRILKLNIV